MTHQGEKESVTIKTELKVLNRGKRAKKETLLLRIAHLKSWERGEPAVRRKEGMRGKAAVQENKDWRGGENARRVSRKGEEEGNNSQKSKKRKESRL